MPERDETPAKAGLALRVRWWKEMLMLRALWALASVVSPARASVLGRRILQLLGPRSKKNRHVRANLRIMCPHRNADEIDTLCREVWGNLGSTLAEFIHLEKLSDTEGDAPAVRIVCENTAPDFLARRKPCVFISGHLGNWELSAWGIRQFGYPVDVIYNPQQNPYLDAMVAARRKNLGVGLVPKQNALRRLMKSLKQGRSVGLHIDVRVDDGPLVPFAGLDATTTTLPAWLARKFECDIVPVHTERIGDGQFRFILHPSIPWRDEGSDEPKSIEQLSAEMNAALAALIQQMPGQWLCTNRRWPKQAMRERGAYSD